MSEFQNLSENELKKYIQQAETALKNKQTDKRKEVIAKIKDLAASIDVQVEIIEGGRRTTSRKSSKVAVKYRHPKDSGLTWTGRGITPKWLKALIDNGHSLDEFKV